MGKTLLLDRSAFPILAAAVLLSVVPVSAADWETVNGPYGGGIVAIDTDAAGNLYAARSDDVFRSVDGGATWDNVSGVQVNQTILSLHVTPDGDIFAGVSSRGVYWSFDGGASWDHDQITHDPHGGLGATIVAIGVDDTGIIFAGGFRSLNNGATWLDMDVSGRAYAFDKTGDVYAGTTAGVHHSADGGATWTPRNTGMEGERVYALALNSSEHLFAGTWDGGIFRSTDAGATWTPVNTGLPSPGVADIAIDGADRVYAALSDGSLHRSTDAGASWQAVDAGLDGRAVLSLAAGAADELFAGSEYHGVYRSVDQGAAWTSLAAASMCQPRLMDLDGSRATGHLFLAAAGGGIYRSTNDGLDWHERGDGLPTTEVEAVAVDSSGRIYAGTREGVYASDDDGATWQPANTGHAGSPAAGLLIDGDDDVVAVLTDSEFFFEFSVVRSTDGGASWQEILDETFATMPTTAATYAVDPAGRLLIAGMSMATEGVIFLSEDDGQSWREIVLGTLGVTDLAVDRAGVIYATLGDNTVHRSTDHGDTWTQLPHGGWPTGTVGLLDVAGVDGHGAVLVSSRYAGFWRSTDGGIPGIPTTRACPRGTTRP